MEYKYQITFFLSNGERNKISFGWLNEDEKNKIMRQVIEANRRKEFFNIEDKKGNLSIINTKHIVEIKCARSISKSGNS